MSPLDENYANLLLHSVKIMSMAGKEDASRKMMKDLLTDTQTHEYQKIIENYWTIINNAVARSQKLPGGKYGEKRKLLKKLLRKLNNSTLFPFLNNPQESEIEEVNR